MEDYRRSQDICLQVVLWMQAKGIESQVLEQQLRPDVESRWDYTDHGDILIEKKKWEVKGRSLSFESVTKFPFDPVFLNEKYKHRADVRGYIIVNRSREGFIFVTSDTEGEWSSVTQWDAAQERECEYIVCPRKCFRYRKLN